MEENKNPELEENKAVDEAIEEKEAVEAEEAVEAKEEKDVPEESKEEPEQAPLSEIEGLKENLKEDEKEEARPDDVSGTYTGTAVNPDNTYFNPIRYINDGTISIDDSMENNRKAFNQKLKKSKIIDGIAVGLMLVSFVAVLLVVFLNKGENALPWLNWVVLAVALVVIVSSFVLTTVYNKKNSKITKAYLNDYEDTLNGYVISDLSVVNPTLCVDAKINDQDIIQAHYFHTINRIESRAVVEGKRKGYSFSLGEVAVVIPTVSIETCNKKPEDYLNLDGSTYVPEPVSDTETGTQELASKDMTVVDLDMVTNGAKKREKDEKKARMSQQTETATGLFGKIYSYGMSVDSEDALIIAFMGRKDATVLPDNLTGFKAVKVPGLRNNIVVYCINPRSSAKFFDEEGVSLLNDIVPNEVVQSLFISVNSYGSKIGMTLSDDIMQLPIRQLSHLGSYELYKDATDKAFAFVDHVQEKAGR